MSSEFKEIHDAAETLLKGYDISVGVPEAERTKFHHLALSCSREALVELISLTSEKST